MTTLSQIAWDDTVLPFQLDASDIRGRVARLDGVLETVLSQHDYPPQVEALVAEAATPDRADRPDDQAALEAVAADPRRRAGAHRRHRLLRPRNARRTGAHPRLGQL